MFLNNDTTEQNKKVANTGDMERPLNIDCFLSVGIGMYESRHRHNYAHERFHKESHGKYTSGADTN